MTNRHQRRWVAVFGAILPLLFCHSPLHAAVVVYEFTTGTNPELGVGQGYAADQGGSGRYVRQIIEADGTIVKQDEESLPPPTINGIITIDTATMPLDSVADANYWIYTTLSTGTWTNSTFFVTPYPGSRFLPFISKTNGSSGGPSSLSIDTRHIEGRPGRMSWSQGAHTLSIATPRLVDLGMRNFEGRELPAYFDLRSSDDRLPRGQVSVLNRSLVENPDGTRTQTITTWSGTIQSLRRISLLTEDVFDNLPAGTFDAMRTFSGTWCTSAAPGGFGGGSLTSCGSARDTYRWMPPVPVTQPYDVYFRWTAAASRSATVPVRVQHAAGFTQRLFDQRADPGAWQLHGRYTLPGGLGNFVETDDSNGEASADAIRIVPSALFETRMLNVSKIGNGFGNVVSALPGINCGEDCLEQYPLGSSVTLTAQPLPGSSFVGWSGACSGVGPCTVSLTDSRLVGARFKARFERVVLTARPGISDGSRSFTGTWCKELASELTLASCGLGSDTYRWTFNVPQTGQYDVFVRWQTGAVGFFAIPLVVHIPYTVASATGQATREMDQVRNGGRWMLLGRYQFTANTPHYAQVGESVLENVNTSADGVRIVSAF